MKKSTYKTIVVGVDFSNYSKLVVKQALQLAKENKMHIVFVHSVNIMFSLSGQLAFVDWDSEFVKPLTLEIISFYKLKKFAPEAQVIVKFGNTSEEIISVAKDFEHPLIIVGHRGASSFMGRFFIGSVAEQLAIHSTFPVWIQQGSFTILPRKILFPCDFSKRTSNSLEAANCLVSSSKLTYEFFHVRQNPMPMLDARRWRKIVRALTHQENADQKELRKRCPGIPIISRRGEVAPLIAAESRKFDLIIMAPHNRNSLFSGFGSVTAKVVRLGNTPVLITH